MSSREQLLAVIPVHLEAMVTNRERIAQWLDSIEAEATIDVLEDLGRRMDKLPNYTAGLLTHTGRYGQGWDDAVAAVHDLMVKTLRDHTKPKEKP